MKTAWVHRYAVFTACATLFLIVAGGLVTSTGSGLAVPDWPLSYGQWFPPMVGGIFYEHGHRMVAAGVGFFTVLLAFWLAWKERRSVRTLGWIALAAVILQGVLGGLTVLFLLPAPISVGHACLGQTFFCIVVAIAVLTSPRWKSLSRENESAAISALSIMTASAIYLQLILGAVMRHIQAGLAIPDFPLSFGHLLPPQFDLPIAIHFAHRVWGAVVFLLALLIFVHVKRRYSGVRSLILPASILLALTAAQIILGGITIWMEKAAIPATAHVATGASILATAVVLAMTAVRRFALRRASWRQLFSSGHDYYILTKPRVTFLVCVTTSVGYYLASSGSMHAGHFIWTVAATALASAGAGTLNQVLERRIDGLMKRTAGRPLPTGRLSMVQGAGFGIALCVLGLSLYYTQVSSKAAVLAAITLVSYLFVYTPLKPVTQLCTIIGAIPGAIPALIGWVAGSGSLSIGAWILFGILFFWQLPHFFSIAWLYRDDYARAKLAVLPVVDPSGQRTARQTLLFSIATVTIALLPTWLGLSGLIYLAGASILGVIFFSHCLVLARERSVACARRVLISSVVYLPFLLALMAADKQ
ncbi:MAG TPA: heme o synthase [Bdellovibrionota bacterium]|nr:heme o synthase [Bdellovibrionota bacterium]